MRSLDWFLTKTGEQGSVPEAQATIVQTVEQSPNFYLDKAWNLPDGSTLKLYHRRTPLVQVQPSQNLESKPGARIALAQVTVLKQAPPGTGATSGLVPGSSCNPV